MLQWGQVVLSCLGALPQLALSPVSGVSMISSAGTCWHSGASVLMKCAGMTSKKRVFSGQGVLGFWNRATPALTSWQPLIGFSPGPSPPLAYLVLAAVRRKQARVLRDLLKGQEPGSEARPPGSRLPALSPAALLRVAPSQHLGHSLGQPPVDG